MNNKTQQVKYLKKHIQHMLKVVGPTESSATWLAVVDGTFMANENIKLKRPVG